MKKISIIVPAYNEAPTLRKLVQRILAVPFGIDYEIIIVDDRSVDQTHEIADALGRDNLGKIKILHNDINRGKGYSIQKGFSQATGDVVIVQDADFESVSSGRASGPRVTASIYTKRRSRLVTVKISTIL